MARKAALVWSYTPLRGCRQAPYSGCSPRASTAGPARRDRTGGGRRPAPPQGDHGQRRGRHRRPRQPWRHRVVQPLGRGDLRLPPQRGDRAHRGHADSARSRRSRPCARSGPRQRQRTGRDPRNDGAAQERRGHPDRARRQRGLFQWRYAVHPDRAGHHGAQADRGDDPQPRLPRSADRPAQPPAVQRSADPGDRAGAAPPAAAGGDDPRSRSLQADQRFARVWRAAIRCCARSASAWSRRLRRSDTVARLGADDFLLLLPGVDGAESAAKVAQKLLDTFACRRWPGRRPGAPSRRQPRHHALSPRRRRRGDADPQRRYRAVSGQGARARQLPVLHHRHERDRVRAPGPGDPAARAHSSGRNWSSTTSPRCAWKTARLSASRPWCAGSTPISA